MNFSPQDREAIIDKAAQIVADMALAGHEADDLVLLPVGTVAKLAGITPRHALRVFPLVSLSERQRAVTLRDYRATLAARRKPPTQPQPCPSNSPETRPAASAS